MARRITPPSLFVVLLQPNWGPILSREEGVPIIVVSQLDRAMLAVSVPSLM